ncbi:MAG TPA: hypothetical protein VHD62_04440 [Opitutaceae bacterium]|nr:hypothetical protein [Opitutaceae bacterium]
MDKPWKVVLAFVGIFIAGAVFGAFFSLGVGKELLAQQPPVGPKRLVAVPPSWQAPQLLGRFTERLDLTADQRERIKPIVQRASEDYRRQWQANVRETGFILERLQNDIRKELTPEQQAKLEKMEKNQHELQKGLGVPRGREGNRNKGGMPGAGFESKMLAPPSGAPMNPPAPPPAAQDEKKE